MVAAVEKVPLLHQPQQRQHLSPNRPFTNAELHRANPVRALPQETGRKRPRRRLHHHQPPLRPPTTVRRSIVAVSRNTAAKANSKPKTSGSVISLPNTSNSNITAATSTAATNLPRERTISIARISLLNTSVGCTHHSPVSKRILLPMRRKRHSTRASKNLHVVAGTSFVHPHRKRAVLLAIPFFETGRRAWSI